MGEVLEDDKIIVFLDDDPNRAAVLYQRMNKRDQERTFWVKTVKETIDILKDYRARLEIVYLDHDLGGKHYVHFGREDCGTEIVRWLEKQNPEQYSHVKFIVHTWNLSAGIRMTQRLKDKGYKVVRIPFGM